MKKYVFAILVALSLRTAIAAVALPFHYSNPIDFV